MATYDPVSTATALAENYVYARQAQLDTASTKAQTQSSALTTLKSSLTTFTSALNTLSGKGSVIAQTATVSSASALTASASSTAAAGAYTFVIDQLATAQQSKFSLSQLGLTAVADNQYEIPNGAGAQIALSVGNAGFVAVDLANADSDGDGKLSVTEIARAVNAAMDGKVTAAVMTDANGQQELLMNAVGTGADGSFQVQALGGTTVAGTTLAVGQDAVFKLGGANGVTIQQSTNTYTGIAGLSLELKQVSSEPVTVTVAKDEAATKANMQSFVDAYNTLVKAMDKLTASGNAESGVAAGALANDSSVRSMRSKLNNLLRSEVGGVKLTDFGISAQRDGTIALDGDRFAKKVAANPDALASLLGQTNTLEYKREGVLGSLQTYVESWTKSTGGLLQSRQDSLQKQQTQFTRQQTTIDNLYAQAYQRYLLQFSTLAGLEEQMGSTTSMLASMFSSSSSS
jgi:flagellar hook-associated protein 2